VAFYVNIFLFSCFTITAAVTTTTTTTTTTAGHAVARQRIDSAQRTRMTRFAPRRPRDTARDPMTSSDDGRPIACRPAPPSDSYHNQGHLRSMSASLVSNK